MSKTRKIRLLTVLCLAAVTGVVAASTGRRHLRHLIATGRWPVFRTVEERLALHEPRVREKLETAMKEAGLAWPPEKILLAAFKEERTLELWCAGADSKYRLVKTYPILAASGTAGPKARRGDRQVPEGFYDLTELNPNSLYHLSLRISYPNDEDVRRSALPLEELGDDIFLHGGDRSVGCIAVGDPAVEELFVAAALSGPGNRRIIISPCDFRRPGAVPPEASSERVRRLWAEIAAGLPGKT